MSWKLQKTETILDTRWVTVRKDSVDLPNGTFIDDFYTVTIPDAVFVVAVTESREIVLKKEFRYPHHQDLIEIPGGIFEPGETDSLTVAKRELLEETGFVSDEWTDLGTVIVDPGKLTNRLHLWFANNCRRVSEQQLDETEIIDVLVIPIEQAIEMVLRNEICCAGTGYAILRVARMLGI